MIALKRAYEKAALEDGVRLLVDRLWPRGVKKANLEVDGWLKDVAPSDSLRRWFAHDPKKWLEFRRHYFTELDSHPAAWEGIRDAARSGRVTLIYSARDPEHNNAAALKEYVDQHLGQRKKAHRAAA
jgi:uncharacterized protein YeaO (DUF488 family)